MKRETAIQLVLSRGCTHGVTDPQDCLRCGRVIGMFTSTNVQDSAEIIPQSIPNSPQREQGKDE